MINYIDAKNFKIKHPISNVIYQLVENFEKRREIVNGIQKNNIIPDIKMIWRNQTIANIIMILRQNILGQIPRSSFSESSKKILRSYFSKPKYQTNKTKKLNYRIHYDLNKAYIYACLCLKDIPVYTEFDNIVSVKEGEKITCGLYMITEKTLYYKKREIFRLNTGVYSHILVKYLLELGLISYKDILYKFVARHFYDGTLIKEFIHKISKKITNVDHFKTVLNQFTGIFNIHKITKKYAIFETCENTVSVIACNYFNAHI